MKIFTLTYEVNNDRYVQAFAIEAERTTALKVLVRKLADKILPEHKAVAVEHLVEADPHEAWEIVREDSLDNLWLDEVNIPGIISFGVDMASEPGISIGFTPATPDQHLTKAMQDAANGRFDPPQYEMRRLMVLSTAHISEETANYLNLIEANSVAEWPATGGVYGENDGWFFYCHEENNGEGHRHIPDDLFEVMKYARLHGCDNLLLDNDGPRVDALPQWEW